MRRRFTAAAGLSIDRYEYADWQDIRGIWALLSEASPYSTFFISPQWVDSWLQVFGPRLHPEILIFHDAHEQSVGACILVRRTIRRGPFAIRRVFLNTTGEDDGESPVIEFNNLLCLEGRENTFCQSLRNYLDRWPWDEVWASGFCEGRPLDELRGVFSDSSQQQRILVDYYVDLDRIRGEQRSYDSTLGSRDRARLRQNYRDYGDVRIYVATTQSSALEILEQLIRLHTKSWNDREQTGAFVSSVFRAFHEGLIRRSFDNGHIQIVRVDTDHGTVGMLYNMVDCGNVYFYQSGFSYTSNKRLRPGFVTLARTIHHCLEQPGLHKFHFMAGGDHYKAPMSTDQQQLYWLIFRKHNLKNGAIELLRRVRRRFRSTESSKTTETGAEQV
ncbi:MAG: GNAT family N-acetyltransferase [Terriglobales bacterium]